MARLLRIKEVMHMTGLSKSSIYEMVKGGRLPKPIPLDGRAVGWLDREIDNWIEEQVTKARGCG